jgi:peptidoglycan/LPS O-acetylase OafA/YrhL
VTSPDLANVPSGSDPESVDQLGKLAPTRLWSLDVFRAASAGVVFLSHWYLWSNFTPRGATEQAVQRCAEFIHSWVTTLTWPTGGHHPAVLAFFVLSGFCIHYPFEHRAGTEGHQVDWRAYYLRRFQRIIPVYWAACVLGAVFVVVETAWPSGSPLLRLHADGTVVELLLRVSGLAWIYPQEIFAGNYILTTVTVEIVIYAGYPIFHRYAVRGRWSELGLTFLLMHALSIVLLRFYTPYWVFNSVLMLGIFWYMGALAAHLVMTRRYTVSGVFPILAWMLFLTLKSLPHFTGLNLLKQAMWGLVCALGVLWAVSWEQRWPGLRDSNVIAGFRGLANISYSLYAVHTPVIMLVTWVLLRSGIASYSAQLLLTLVASIFVTSIVHYRVERFYYRKQNW